jgi:hypothetical protein
LRTPPPNPPSCKIRKCYLTAVSFPLLVRGGPVLIVKCLTKDRSQFRQKDFFRSKIKSENCPNQPSGIKVSSDLLKSYFWRIMKDSFICLFLFVIWHSGNFSFFSFDWISSLSSSPDRALEWSASPRSWMGKSGRK